MSQTDPNLQARPASSPLRIAVLASGGGSNLRALLDRFNRSADAPARVEAVIVSRPGIGALEHAAAAKVRRHLLDPLTLPLDRLTSRMLGVLDAHEIDLIVLAGYLHLVPAAVVRHYYGRILNVHPALLPSFGGQGFYGERVHRAVLQSGARVSGVTVHIVDERYDTGPIVAQWPVPVLVSDTPKTLAARVLQLEHRLLPAVVEAFARQDHEQSPLADPVVFDLVASPAPDFAPMHSLVRLPGRFVDG